MTSRSNKTHAYRQYVKPESGNFTFNIDWEKLGHGVSQRTRLTGFLNLLGYRADHKPNPKSTYMIHEGIIRAEKEYSQRNKGQLQKVASLLLTKSEDPAIEMVVTLCDQINQEGVPQGKIPSETARELETMLAIAAFPQEFNARYQEFISTGK